MRANTLLTALLAGWALVPGTPGQEPRARPPAESRPEGSGNDRKETGDEIRRLLENLQEQVLELEERVGDRAQVRAFDARSFDIGGFASQTLALIDSDKGRRAAFDLGQFELMVKAEIDDRWSAFTLLEFRREAKIDESDPSNLSFGALKNEAELELYSVAYEHSDSLRIRLGRFITPHGIINIEHFHPTLLHIPYPRFMRQGREATIFPRFTIGMQAGGSWRPAASSRNRFQYDIYTGSSKKEPGRWIGGARMAWEETGWGTALGVNAGFGRHTEGAGFGDYRFLGLDFLIDQESLLWKSEYYYSFERNRENRIGFYSQPALRLGKGWIAFYRYDVSDPGQGRPDLTEHVVGLNFLPDPLVRLRLSASWMNWDRPTDQQAAILRFSATISF